ncbi:uncharacterized protein LOC121858595 isoform X2 [Homarus americanus]|uniref:uncharacterized protein LOC121858595 isoform X2 n=1 Tax=Homarus americanus TaxID=6706 RepID=UPI001C4425F0|nr:uncharacterized protein LOC121858595 isoform X2 [Homarus americanus]
MDKQKAKILFDLLRSSSNDKVIRGLREIKKRLLTNNENIAVFRSLGLVPQTLKLVQRPNEDILNGALSILSGCCTSEGSRSEVFNIGGVPHLLNVLKCAKSEALQLRACRTMANQALHRPSCEIFFKLKAVDHILELLLNCKEDDTKLAAIRALRLLASSGEHCQKIVMNKGILHICKVGFGSPACPSSPELVQSTIKAIAHFSRVSHPACVSQIMEGTNNMMCVTKMSGSTDLEIYECVLRIILNIIHTCFESTTHRRDALDAKVIDHLCTALAPTIIVSELQNRRVTGIEEKLILALCKFCKGSSECNNLAFGSFSEPPTFLGRAWTQLMECGGVALLVSLLTTHRNHVKLRPAILKAILGVENIYSFKDTILKYFLAAKLLPQLAEQFDELMAEYRKLRQDIQPGCCIHTIRSESLDKQNELQERDESEEMETSDDKEMKFNIEEKENPSIKEDEKDSCVSSVSECQVKPSSTSTAEVPSCSKLAVAKNVSRSASQTSQMITPKVNDTQFSFPSTEEGILGQNFKSKMDSFQQKSLTLHSFVKENSKSPLDSSLPASPDNSTYSNPRSPLMYSYHNPKSPGSLSCSPRSNQSGSGSSHGSPTWSPAQGRSESPTFSPPCFSLPQSSPINILPWPFDLSTPVAPYISPPCSPIMQSPPRSTSPIKYPSDWEYDDEEEMEQSDGDGRFSPVVHDTKGNDCEENKEDISELEEDSVISNDETSQEGETSGTAGNTKNPLTDDMNVSENQTFTEDIDEKLMISSPSGKRLRNSSSTICSTVDIPQGKKIKCDLAIETQEESECNLAMSEEQMTEGQSSSLEPSEKEADKEPVAEGEAGKSPFVRLNQIKFRVRKKGLKRQTGLPAGDTKSDVYSPVKELEKSPEVKQGDCQPLRGVRRTSSICSNAVYTDLSTEDAQNLELLELVVRAIGQVAHVKEAINPVCREFVPRIMTYLSTAQVIHKSATRMLVTVARNSLCIQPLLDSLFIPYVAVELGEAGDPESPNGCPQCRILSEGAVAFLDQMVNFFNHIHQYGQCEVSNRLQRTREHSVREGCVMALPHITRCPKLLYDFMVGYPALDMLMKVLHSEMPPNEASYMYATAAISRLATTLQLENQFKPVMCAVCLRQGKHTPEEVAEHIKMQQKSDKKLNFNQDNAQTLVGNSSESEGKKPTECKWGLDEIKDVTFKLEDGSTVSANREFLAEKNEVLRGMLKGTFVEGVSSFVEWPCSSKTPVEMLIHFLYGCRCDFMESRDIKTYIELMFLSQMYLVENLYSYAVFKMMSSISDGDDIIKIYESGVGRMKNLLQALCKALVKPMKTWKRARWMKELFQSEHSEDIDHNIRMIIHHPLNMNRYVCNCDLSLSLYMACESVYGKLC